FDLFSNKSFHEVTLDEIARQANVSKGAIFHHFKKGKKELLWESVNNFMTETTKLLIGEEDIISADPKMVLHMIIDGFLGYILRFPKTIFVFIHVFDLKSDTDVDKRIDYADKMRSLYINYFELLVIQLRKLNIKNPEAVSRVLLSALDGFMVQIYFFNVKSMTDNIVAEFRKGIYALLGIDEIPEPLDIEDLFDY
ncbi:MAG: TetR/AcrR family transcriptional regulator, partial [Candidatus Thorarchaeota archaeon]